MELSTVELPPVLTRSGNRNGNAAKKVRNSKKSNPAIAGSVTFKRTEITIDYTVYTRTGRTEEIPDRDSLQRIASTEPDVAEIAILRADIQAEILEQVKAFLGTFFEKNPEAAEEISQGIIPEYFNVDNTARRILNIYFARFEQGEDKVAFAERAISIIKQAYGDVESIVGGLPEIVLQTRSKVMEILDIFAQGGDISDFMQTVIEKNG